MRRLRSKSLTMRIWTTFTLIILIIICSISFIYLVAYNGYERKAKIQDLKAVHNIQLKNGDYDMPIIGFSNMKNLRGCDSFILNIGKDNRTNIISINKKDGPPGKPPVPYMEKPQDYETRMWIASFISGSNVNGKVFTKNYNNMKVFFVVSNIKYNIPGETYLVTYMPDFEDNSLIYMVLVIGILFIGMGFIAAKVVAGYISKPLKELEDFTVRIAKKDFTEPIKIKSEDEIGRLSEAMNKMQKELKRADEEEKMFLQSISHDLKTPVMVIMSHADAIIDGVYIDSIEKTAEIIKDEAVCLEKKIKQMLYLNTLDYVLENNNESQRFDLHDLLHHIISRFEVINSSIEWILDIDKIIINGNEEKMKVSIENILDNALRYADKKISITLKREGSFAMLDIYDDGKNIDEKHMGHIFDNLYKDKTGNFGLGLAISKKIVNFYKGEITAVNREKGVSFIIKYPI